MSPIVHRCPNLLAAAIGNGLPAHADRARSASLATLALMMTLGGLGSAEATTNFVVTTTQDPNLSFSLVGLRDAINQANANPLYDSVITFAPSLAGKTITLHGGELAITRDVSFVSPGAGGLTISGNDASRIFHIVGGGKLGAPVSVGISGLTLTRGASPAGQGGGAIETEGQTNLMLNQSVISGSHAAAGGAVAMVGVLAKGLLKYYCGGYLSVTRSVISGNSATQSGGGISAGYCTNTHVYYSTIAGNSAYDYGGGLFADSAFYVQVFGSLVSGNLAGGPASPLMGGAGIAVRNIYYGARIQNSTITGNSATAEGGGIALLDASTSNVTAIDSSTISGNYGYSFPGQGIAAVGGTTTLVNSIVANNSSRFENEDLAGTFASDHSLIQTPGAYASVTGSGNLLGPDPMLAPLHDNGGFALSMLPAAASPVIGAGSTTLTFDQRGSPRPGAPGTDIGAIQRQYPEQLVFRSSFD